MRPVELTRTGRPAVPVDMALALPPHRSAIGATRLVSIELRPAPRNPRDPRTPRYWVEVESDVGATHTLPRPTTEYGAVRFAKRFGVDAHSLAWEPDDCGPETTANPFA